MENVIPPARVSTEADSRAGLEAQRAAILAEAKRRGWQHVTSAKETGYSGKDLRRPGVSEALEALQRKRADALVVAKLDRLSRSMLDFAALMNRATREHWALLALDLKVDAPAPAGEAAARVLATFAQFERRLISERTKAALAALKAQGVRIGGRARVLPLEVIDRIVAERRAGRTLWAIADGLMADDTPTAHGGKRWYASTVRTVLRSEAARRNE